jgi:hypothetical protein
MLSTVYTMGDNSKAWELVKAVADSRPAAKRTRYDDSLCVVASSGVSGNGSFKFGYGDPESVLQGLRDMPELHKAKVSIGGLEVESTSGGAAHLMREMNPFNIIKGNPVKIADLEAKVADNARYTAGLEYALAELGRKNDVLAKEARDDKAVVTKLTETVQCLMADVKVHETKADDDEDVIKHLTTALRICGRQGKEAADAYTSRFPKIHAMLRDDEPKGV